MGRTDMRGIIYIIGLVVIVLAIVRLFFSA